MKKYKKYNPQELLVKKELRRKYDVTSQFVNAALRGDRESELALEIKSEYARIMQELDNVLK